eukprot:CAMPEP_0178394710 /NCGR_PEP_ID=MMETSP0689_2-20121128/12847_1 /TAXON_ID=160604 /ORGANISM="Amphidinium massartii, Strain CS-259" /LENGTH=619 /DNA_ID=CAMNT_0020015349 /DNA_START=30 /DNA_END=1887 /DNA_ORIENTATION=+
MDVPPAGSSRQGSPSQSSRRPAANVIGSSDDPTGSVTSSSSSVAPAVLGALNIELPDVAPPATPQLDDYPGVITPRKATKALQWSCRAVSLGFMAAVFLLAMIDWPARLIDNNFSRSRILSSLFAIGLMVVALEDVLGVNKSAVVLCLAATMWSVLAVSLEDTDAATGQLLLLQQVKDQLKEVSANVGNCSEIQDTSAVSGQIGQIVLHQELADGLKEVGSVVLFLLPAMGVVESIDHFNGFDIVTKGIRHVVGKSKGSLLPIVCLVSFALSSVIDNLTSTIVVLKILRHLVPDQAQRHECGALVVLAANAGGAWSPIGDVTTTMLWIQKKITVNKMVVSLFPASLVAGFSPLLAKCCCQRRAAARAPTLQKSSLEADPLRISGLGDDFEEDDDDMPLSRRLFPLVLGISVIVMVPVLKMWSRGLPPYLGMLLALGIFWLATDLSGISPRKEGYSQAVAGELEAYPIAGHAGAEGADEGVVTALKGLDLTGLLFFSGILFSVGALASAGILKSYSENMVRTLPDSPVLVSVILGISSSIVDNVPLVQAAIDMFDEDHVVDDPLWHLIALTAGTGGSILSIGSIAGVTLMSMEGVSFMWYARNVSFWAFFSFLAGVGTYQ